jgi:hypothetical protein
MAEVLRPIRVRYPSNQTEMLQKAQQNFLPQYFQNSCSSVARTVAEAALDGRREVSRRLFLNVDFHEKPERRSDF